MTASDASLALVTFAFKSLTVVTASLASLSAVHALSASLALDTARSFSLLVVTAELRMHRSTHESSASSEALILASCISLPVSVFDATLSAVIELSFTVRLPVSISMNVSSTLAEMVLPDLDRPLPASISPADENWENTMLDVPSVIESVVCTYAVSAPVEPCSTKTAHAFNSSALSASVARVKTACSSLPDRASPCVEQK